MSDNYHLRLDFPVSVEYVGNIRVGNEVTGRVESLGGRPFRGKISRATWMVNNETRTMMTEIEVANPDLKLVPGMYAAVSVPVQVHSNAIAVPIEAVAGGETTTVYVIDTHHEVEVRKVALGIETPTAFEYFRDWRLGSWC